ncbi:ABC-type Fe3+ transport system, permease component [gamma proteobacterium HdN1]|nr:ABC-type Fe3+ transport system, permease component [gamma proteobacterium HdN1]
MRSLFVPCLVLLLLIIGAPVLVVLASLFQPFGGVWAHLADTVLQDYVRNSLLLVAGVSVGVLLMGVSTAWLTSLCQFPGRRIFEWALLLPMAMPAYIIAYTYTGMLDFGGPVQTLLRDTFDWRYGDYWFPEIRSLPGAIVMLSLVLYPYVYLLARAAFLEQSVCLLEVSRSLGCNPWRSFFGVALPLARPAILAGLSLALMETLADYGTVQYFGVNTFTTGIFRTWFGLGENVAATQLSALLLCSVVLLLLLERYFRHGMRVAKSSRVASRMLPRFELRGVRSLSAWLVCTLILSAGFLLPAIQLLKWTVMAGPDALGHEFLLLAWRSFYLAFVAAVLVVVVAMLFTFALRLKSTPSRVALQVLAGLGYAVPGTVIAVGVMIVLGGTDRWLDNWMIDTFGISTGLLFSGTICALLFAYLVRFLSVSLHALQSGFERISKSMDEAARSQGLTPFGVICRIHLPLLRGSLFAALLLVFVDVLKELSATLVLRPFNFNTLAVRAFEMASDERLMDAAPPSLAIVLIGLLPVILLSRQMRSRSAEKLNSKRGGEGVRNIENTGSQEISNGRTAEA